MAREKKTRIRVFVSHSHADAAVVRRLVALIQAGLQVSPEEIRCSSINRFAPKGGVAIADRLREELRECATVVCALTRASIHSRWLLMELGAAWAFGKPTIPLLAPHVALKDVPGPLVGVRVLKMNYRADMDGFLDSLAFHAHVRKKPANAEVTLALGRLAQYFETKVHAGTSPVGALGAAKASLKAGLDGGLAYAGAYLSEIAAPLLRG